MNCENNKPNIVMLITNYGYGGAQKVFSQLAVSLSVNYNIIKIVFNDEQNDVYKSRGESVSLNVTSGSNIVSKAVKFLLRCWRLYKLKNKYSPILTISHLEGANFVNALSFGRGAAILCVHGSKTAYDSNRQGIIKFIENQILTPLLYNLAFKIVTVSQGISEELVSFFNIKKEKVLTIQNGVDINNIRLLANEPLTQYEKQIFNKKTIVFSGRLAPQKNPLAIIEIYNQLENKDEINLLIIGDGPLKEEMINKCEKLNLLFFDALTNNYLDARVFFVGFRANPFKFIRHASLFAITSDFEGFPLAPIEAIALGIPVIATDCPTGTREILSKTNNAIQHQKLTFAEHLPYGVLMPILRNEMAIQVWAKEIQNLLGNSKLLEQLSTMGLERASQLSLSKSMTKWKNLIESIILSNQSKNR